MRRPVGVKLVLLYFRWTCFFFGRVAADDILPSALSRSDFVRSVQVGRSRFSRAFGVVLNFCSRTVWPVSSNTQYQLDRSPRSSPTVNFCREIFVLRCAATVLTFFIAGLLFICALSTSITWERTPHPVRRPAFSSHLFSSVIPGARFSSELCRSLVPRRFRRWQRTEQVTEQ
jgi:hypothetical protein